MTDNEDDEFLRRLQATFRGEARERLQILSSALIELENASPGARQLTLIEAVFREVHSLKGAARAVEKSDVEKLCQSLENLLSQLKREAIVCSAAVADALLRAADLLERLLAEAAILPSAAEVAAMCAQLDGIGQEPALTTSSSAPVNQSTAINAEHNPAVERAAPIERTGGAGTMRIASTKLDALLLKIDNLLSVKLTTAQRIDDISALDFDISALKKTYGKTAGDLRLLQQKVVGEDATLRRMLETFSQQEILLKSIDAKLNRLKKDSTHDGFNVGGIVNALLDDMKGISMMPIVSAFDILPRLVRDIAHSSGKDIELNLRGGSIEIDRRILDELRDPLLHLVRNAIDHGIEKTEQRVRGGKPPRAQLSVEAAQADGKIQLTISDDGAGIDRERVREAALRLGRTVSETAEGDAQLLMMIFESGLSTSPMVTDISGRGLGLAIVREKIEALGGSIAVQSTPGKGTQFRLILPLTLATYRGVHVSSGGRQFIFPLMHVECVTRFKPSDINLVQNRDAVTWNNQAIALVRLSDVLELAPHNEEAADTLVAVIAMMADQRIAFLVDSVLGELEVLVKNLGRQLQRVCNIGAATVLGDGSLALILNVPDLFKSAARGTMHALQRSAEGAPPKSILVAEDSITSRMLLRGVLEAAGYRVSVAVDGEDAFAKLRSDAFDLLISDVDMPRLSGFDLAARVRADQHLQTLPIVLVTSLASNDDRERGIDVGANAYIVKSNFEEGNLLAAIQRLI